MSFLTNKELIKSSSRKAPSKQGGRASKTTKNGDIVQAAKAERLLREAKRLEISSATKLQAWWRSRRFTIKFQSEVLINFDKRLSDIEKLNKVLKQQGKSLLIPPFSVTSGLLNSFMYLTYSTKTDMTSRVKQLSQLVLLPSFKQTLETTNNQQTEDLYSFSSLQRLAHFCNLSLRSLGQSQHFNLEIFSMILDIIKHCVGPLSSIPSPGPQVEKHAHMRKELLDRDSFFLAVRAAFTTQTENLLHSPIETAVDHLKHQDHTNPFLLFSESLVNTCLAMMEADADLLVPRLRSFCSLILTIPLLSLGLSSRCLSALCRWRCFESLLQQLVDPSLPLADSQGHHHSHTPQGDIGKKYPKTVLGLFTSGQWLLGNVSSLMLFVAGGETIEHSIRSDVLESYLNVCQTLLFSYSIPGALKRKEAYVWDIEDPDSGVTAVPSALLAQIQCLYNAESVGLLYHHVLEPINHRETLLGSRGEQGQGIDAMDVEEEKGRKKASTGDGDEWEVYAVPADVEEVRGALLRSRFNHVMTSSRPEKRAQGLMPSLGLVRSLCGLWAVLLPFAATAGADSLPWKTLTQIAFSFRPVASLWRLLLGFLQREQRKIKPSEVDFNPFLRSFSAAGVLVGGSVGFGHDGLDVLITLVSVLRVTLIALDGSELYTAQHPIPLHQLIRLIRSLRTILYKIIKEDPSLTTPETPPLSNPLNPTRVLDPNAMDVESSSDGNRGKESPPTARVNTKEKGRRQLLQAISKTISAVLNDLYARWARRPFSHDTLWEQPEAQTSDVIAELKTKSPFAEALFRVMPWTLNFLERMKFFRAALDSEKLNIQGSNDWQNGPGYRSRGIMVRVRRDHLLEDGMAAWARIGAHGIKDRVVVRYVNEFGEEEPGIDAGGLFKDFVTDLSISIFDPSYGLFSLTSDHLLFPNPCAPQLFEKKEMDGMYQFLGRVLGKALFENITLQPRFAHFFLAFMHGKYNFMNLIDDLGTFDPELYKNLMFLKSYEGDVSDLSLTFSINDTSLGSQEEVELIPNGSNIAVDATNRHRYVNLAAKYYLHDRLNRQARAFFSGLNQVINPELLSLFCAPELQVLISGSLAGVDLTDLKNHTFYAGGYFKDDPEVNRFWDLLENEFTDEEVGLLLRFVTSCERPPSLGFSSLQPPFTLQRVEVQDDLRLPSASTCFNILKLPTYSSTAVLKQKLLTAIKSKSGFDLS